MTTPVNPLSNSIGSGPDEIRLIQGLIVSSSQGLSFHRDLRIFYTQFADGRHRQKTDQSRYLSCSGDRKHLSRAEDKSRCKYVMICQMIPKPVNIHSIVSSRSVSPFSRKLSPPRFATPVPTTSGLSFTKGVADSLKKTNGNLNQEVNKLRMQVDSLRNQCDIQELELQKSRKKAHEAIALAAKESAKCKAAKDVIRTLMEQELSMSENDGPVSANFRKALKDFVCSAEGEARSLASLYYSVQRG